MLRLIFAVAIVVAVFWAMKSIRQLPPEQRKKRYISLGIGGFAGLLIVLAITGRVHWIGAAIGALLPIARALGPSIMRVLPGLIGRQSSASDASSQTKAENAHDMRLEEARAILGLEPPYDRDAVIKAHRQLMQKLHPDRGGNNFLASQLNAAKDCLLEELEGH